MTQKVTLIEFMDGGTMDVGNRNVIRGERGLEVQINRLESAFYPWHWIKGIRVKYEEADATVPVSLNASLNGHREAAVR